MVALASHFATSYRPMSGWRIAAVVFLVTAWGTAPVRAATFQAFGSIGFQFDSTFLSLGDSYNRTGFNPTGGQVNFDDAGGTFPGVSVHNQADSLGVPGFLRAHTFAQMITSNENPNDHSLSGSSNSTIIAHFSDVTVLGPTGSPSSVVTQLAFHVDGSFITGSTAVNGFGTAAANGVSIGVAINGQNGGNGAFFWASQDGSPPAQVSSNGLLTNFTGSLDFLSSFVSVPVGQPFDVTMTLQTSANVSGPINHGLHLDANTNFSNTFSFATDRPVIGLPDGYTANSGDAGIVNNSFALPVPEPATRVMSATLLGLCGALWARKRLSNSA
jgi:hypothetical protein